MGILIMVGSLLAIIVIAWALVLRFDPEARGPRPDPADARVDAGDEGSHP